ncbi:MAG TPA: 16S rRNA (adenine(1518)-N(6)/adenine(1519)-N(6))-dimethyltransferase RsmA [Candidatus Dormibacteraeota bacterium]|nr:16S rRNA (adenine(1518)-N(6)/adenine(1519)-N(6))-dimethyltransferase RsmA [Candidatus Dormibacteraeota bacterium]
MTPSNGAADRSRSTFSGKPGELTAGAGVDPADFDQLQRILARHGVTPKHDRGQNFLIDPGLRDDILEAAGIRAEDQVLEIGAGPGALTARLVGKCRRLVVVEVERRLVHFLRRLGSGVPGFEVIERDILEVDLGHHFPGGGEVVLGNIPYYLTGVLVRRLLEAAERPARLALVVQKEVAWRWTRSGEASLGSVAVSVFARPRLEFILPAAAFWPVPKVDSALVVLEVRDHPLIPAADQARFFDLVESVFQARRKQLGGTLAKLNSITPDEAGSRLLELGIDPSRRPQTLDLEEWVAVRGAFSQ